MLANGLTGPVPPHTEIPAVSILNPSKRNRFFISTRHAGLLDRHVAFYEYAYDTARLARSKGIKNLLISNGFINERPLKDLCKYLDAANINLKSFSDDIYARLNGGSLQPVLNTLKL